MITTITWINTNHDQIYLIYDYWRRNQSLCEADGLPAISPGHEEEVGEIHHPVDISYQVVSHLSSSHAMYCILALWRCCIPKSHLCSDNCSFHRGKVMILYCSSWKPLGNCTSQHCLPELHDTSKSVASSALSPHLTLSWVRPQICKRTCSVYNCRWGGGAKQAVNWAMARTCIWEGKRVICSSLKVLRIRWNVICQHVGE